MTLVLDASGSINQSHAVNTVRDAAGVFLNALKDTGSTARVIDFGSVARQTAPATLVTTDSLAPGGVHADALTAYYNPIPPLQAGVSAYAWRGGSVTNPDNYQRTTSTQYTNWDQSIDQAGAQPSDLVVYVTDGDPTAVDSDQPGDPFYVAGKNPPNVRVGMDSGAALQLSLDRAIQEANQVKSAGTRMLAVGVGSAVTQTDSVARLVQIAGPQVVRDTSGDHEPQPGRRRRRPRLRRPRRAPADRRHAALLAVAGDPQAGADPGQHPVRAGPGLEHDGQPDDQRWRNLPVDPAGRGPGRAADGGH